MYLDFDQVRDVLYIKRDDVKIKTSRDFFKDSHIIISYDDNYLMVGAIILEAHSYINYWARHPVRQVLPEDIVNSLDAWFLSQQS